MDAKLGVKVELKHDAEVEAKHGAKYESKHGVTIGYTFFRCYSWL